MKKKMAKKKEVVGKKKKKKPFHKMTVTRIKLNPEQAVLSCCDANDKDLVHGVSQCERTPCVIGAGTASIAS